MLGVDAAYATLLFPWRLRHRLRSYCDSHLFLSVSAGLSESGQLRSLRGNNYKYEQTE